MARVRALLRRAGGPAAQTPQRAPLLTVGDLSLDTEERVAIRDGKTIDLTAKEYDILRLLLLHQGKVMTHRQLLREIWGPRHEEDTHYLRVHIAHLRQKLGDSDPENRIIRAESGLGYRIAADGAE
mgnify:CR=1 FL=1